MSFKPCYFCDDLGWYPGTCLQYFDGFYVCHDCYSFTLPIDYGHQEQDECDVCFEDTTLLTLPCNHRLCLPCCKTIYFGIATTEKPIHWRELGNGPDWPFELDDDNDDDPERIKYDEYQEFRSLWFDTDNSYETLIEIRNNLFSLRPTWMNTYTFLKYENEDLKYSCECARAEKAWDEYNYQKFKGNGSCPLCMDNTHIQNDCISCFFRKLNYGTM